MVEPYYKDGKHYKCKSIRALCYNKGVNKMAPASAGNTSEAVTINLFRRLTMSSIIPAPVESQKWCPLCSQSLPFSQFYKCNSLQSGYRNYCKPCRRKKEQSGQISFCKCGCGESVYGGRKYVSGHNLRNLRRTPEHNQKIGKAQKQAWSTKRVRKPIGSKNYDSRGYVRVKVVEGQGRWKKEHILAMEKELSRELTAAERVHHINLRKTDNRPENLFLCSNSSEHATIHRALEKLVGELFDTGFIRFNQKEKRYEIARES